MRSQESLSLQVVPLSFLTSLFALQAMSSLDLTTKQLPPTSTATNQLWFQRQKSTCRDFCLGFRPQKSVGSPGGTLSIFACSDGKTPFRSKGLYCSSTMPFVFSSIFLPVSSPWIGSDPLKNGKVGILLAPFKRVRMYTKIPLRYQYVRMFFQRNKS